MRRLSTVARHARIALPLVAALGLLAASPVAAQERELEQGPAAASIYEIESPLEQAYPEPHVRTPLFPSIQKRIEPLPPFFSDSKLYLRYRTYYFRRDRTNRLVSEAWAMGGSLYYHSGWLKERFAVELETFTSQPVNASDSRDGTLLLRPGQKGYTVLGVANAKLRHGDFTLTGFRQKLDLPYLNQQDNRMTPNTFEAVKFAKERGSLRFSAGYAWRFKGRNDDDFDPLSNRAGVSQDRGAAFADVLWSPGEALHAGVSAFVVPDLLATAYAETHYSMPLTDAVDFRIDAQFTHQQSVGDELIAGSSFETWNLGLRGAASWLGAVARLAFAVTDDDRRIENFYGSNPTYISLMQRSYTRAGEKAALISLSYDLSRLGVEDLSAVANFAQGWNGKVAGERRDSRELDVTVDYRIGRGSLKSLWLRLRGSWHHDQGTPKTATDFRVILRYELPVI